MENGQAGESGKFHVELPEYSVDGDKKTFFSPYKVITGKKKVKVDLRKNSTIDL